MAFNAHPVYQIQRCANQRWQPTNKIYFRFFNYLWWIVVWDLYIMQAVSFSLIMRKQLPGQPCRSNYPQWLDDLATLPPLINHWVEVNRNLLFFCVFTYKFLKFQRLVCHMPYPWMTFLPQTAPSQASLTWLVWHCCIYPSREILTPLFSQGLCINSGRLNSIPFLALKNLFSKLEQSLFKSKKDKHPILTHRVPRCCGAALP